MNLWAEDVTRTGEIERVIRLRRLQRFREARIHVAVVRDELGGVEGIVTPTGVLEGLVGELPQIGEVVEAGDRRIDRILVSVSAPAAQQ